MKIGFIPTTVRDRNVPAAAENVGIAKFRRIDGSRKFSIQGQRRGLSPEMKDAFKPQSFCVSQRLTVLTERQNLKYCLAGETLFAERHGLPRKGEDGRPMDPVWKDLNRDDFVTEVRSGGEFHRACIVTAAGMGKSTNSQWLAYRINQGGDGRVAILLSVSELPSDLGGVLKVLATNMSSKAALEEAPELLGKYLHLIRRLRASGRLCLVFDSIDQAQSKSVHTLQALVRDPLWQNCPMIVSSRAHAVHSHWDGLIRDRERAWRFVRIEELREPERQALCNQDGVAIFEAVPLEGRSLLAIPRVIEFVRRLAGENGRYLEKLTKIKTKSHLFWQVSQGFVEHGFKAKEARRIRRALSDSRSIPRTPTALQVDHANRLLAALAFTMVTGAMPKDVQAAKLGPTSRPKFDQVGAGDTEFAQQVVDRLKRTFGAWLGEGPFWKNYSAEFLERDLKALAAMNAHITHDLFDEIGERTALRWYNRELEEFFAALWVTRFAGPEDRALLPSMLYDAWDEDKSGVYAEFWRFAAEMPDEIVTKTGYVDAMRPLYATDAKCRSTEMIYRSWESLESTPSGKAVLDGWLGEYLRLKKQPKRSKIGRIVDSIEGGFVRCPKDPKDDWVPFRMGSTEKQHREVRAALPAKYKVVADWQTPQHDVIVTPFLLHRHAVCNEQYELFDPAHQHRRWSSEWEKIVLADHPAGDDRRYPVVLVSWYDAWCFARWSGSQLPTEGQWEYACRAGTTTHFSWGDSCDGSECACDGEYPFGTDLKGTQHAATVRVDAFAANRWELKNMHGNVYEWCQDWFRTDEYSRRVSDSKGQAITDPENTTNVLYWRAVRGGSWYYNPILCRAAFRYHFAPVTRYRDSGVRLSRTVSVCS